MIKVKVYSGSNITKSGYALKEIFYVSNPKKIKFWKGLSKRSDIIKVEEVK